VSDGRVTRWPIVVAIVLVAIGAGWMAWTAMRPVPRPIEPTLPGDAVDLSDSLSRFVWPREPSADVYRLEVYDLSLHLLAGAIVRDTSAPARALLPDSAHAGRWRVVPVTKGGLELPPIRTGSFVRR
jgi:hypothetical protein